MMPCVGRVIVLGIHWVVGFLLGHPVNLKETHALQVDNWSHFFDIMLSIFGVNVPKQICKKTLNSSCQQGVDFCKGHTMNYI